VSPINPQLFRLLLGLWRHFSPRRRGQFGLLLVLMVIGSFSEILSIGAVLPFLAILTDPPRVFSHPSAQPIVQALGLSEPNQLLLPLTIAFSLSALFAGAMRLLLLWASIRLSYATGADLSISIYRRTLYQPYAVHVARNSSEVINGIYGKSGIAINIINMTLTIVGSSIMMIAILFTLLSIDAAMAIAAFGGFGLIYALIIGLTRERLLKNSQTHARESTFVIKSLQEGLGGIRDVLIDGSQATYCKIYSKADQSLRRAEGNSSFISSSPRSVVEALGMLLIAAIAYLLAQRSEGIASVLPVLGALALGAQRLLPTLQQAYGAWSSIQSSYAALSDTLELLNQPIPDYAQQDAALPLPFQQTISLKQITFRYNTKTPCVLNNLDLTITKGSRVGFIGVTGSGKSTLIDIVMGLLEPTSGIIEIDGQPITFGNHRAWQSHIAHVPQSIFLADSTIAENIAFGVPKHQIDHKRLQQAARQAQIEEQIETWPNKYQTRVGERGVSLSGGQRQRIGIARALYKQADVIIFDEATSSLDNETETNVMQAIDGLGEEITLLIIAHRLSTLKNCTQILEIGEGGIKRTVSYQEMIGKGA
jgi:ABC-type multidrug transport system fused ATPase/permease subunit